MGFYNDDPIKEKGNFFSGYEEFDPIEDHGSRKYEDFGVDEEYNNNYNKNTSDSVLLNKKLITYSKFAIILFIIVMVSGFWNDLKLIMRKRFGK